MITRLKVQNFRTHKNLEFSFQPGLTIITGPNGSGKTSLVEAIYIVLQGKSWRSNFAEIIKSDSTDDWWRIDVDFINGEKRVVKFVGGKKIFEIDGQDYARLPTRLKKPIVLFEPGDLQILYGSPSRRRDFFDRFICQVEPTHETNLRRFERVLAQRNNLLKSGAARENLFIWDIQFADLAEKIVSARLLWLEKIDQQINKHYQKIAENQDEISLRYGAATKTRNQILAQLDEDFSRGLNFTKTGPQTHDVLVKLNNHDAKTTASRGENRTILFAILYAMIDLINQESGAESFVIFDDVDGELDDKRRKNLYENEVFQRNFVFATTIESKHQPKNHLRLG